MDRGDCDGPPDVRLAHLILEGDGAAEDLFVRRHLGAVQRMVRLLTHDSTASVEIVDDVFMVTLVALRRGGVRDTRRVRAFMHGVAVHLVHAHDRARQRRAVEVPLTVDTAAAAEGLPWDEVGRTVLRRVMASLSLDDRRILDLVQQGYTPEEVARGLGIGSAAARQRKSRALRRLRRRLRGEDYSR